MTIFLGYWSDVFEHPEGIGLIVFEPPKSIALYVNSEFRARMPLPDSVLYLRGAADENGDVAFIAQPGNKSGTMTGMIGSVVIFRNVTCYSRPAIAYNGERFVYYVQNGPRTWRRWEGAQDPATVPNQPIPVWPGGDGSTSQGISQAHDGGTTFEDVIWHDQVSTTTINGVTIRNFVYAMGVMVGQGQESGTVGFDPQGQPFLAMPFDPQEPRLAYSPKRKVWACCSHNLKPEVGYVEMPPFVPLPVEPPTPVYPDDPPTSPIISFPGYTFSAASYGRRGYCGPFEGSDIRHGDFVFPGNTHVLKDGTVDVGNVKVDYPFFVTLQSTHCSVDKTIGLFALANDDSPGNAGIKAVRQWYLIHGRKCELIRYFDGPIITQAFIDGCEPDAIIMPQSIPLDHETAAQSILRFGDNLGRIDKTGRRFGIDRGLNVKYGGPNTATVKDRVGRVLAVQSGLCDLVANYDRCVVDLWFSWGRWAAPGGVVVDAGAAYIAEFQTVAKVLGGLFTGLP